MTAPTTTARKYFGTDGIRGRVGSDHMNAAFALRLGYAAGMALAHTNGHGNSHINRTTRPCVLIGKDTRVSGYMIESALEAGLASAGVDSLLCGPIPTPAVAYLTRTLHLAAGIVISASHNPYFDNGIKFFSSTGHKLPDAVELQIEHALDAPMQCVQSEHLGRARRLADAAGRYIEFCKSSFPNELSIKGLKLVVDGAHGAAYHIAPHVFEELGAQVISIGCEPNGLNINDGVGALHPERLAKAVVEHQADLGIALDGDADRLQIVDRHGRIFNGDELLYAITLDRLRSGAVAGVVGTQMTNLALEHRLQQRGIGFSRAQVGDRYVMEQLQAKGWLLGGESSGHLIMLDKHTTGDGTIAALQVLALLARTGQSLADNIQDLTLYTQHMINVPVVHGFNWRQHAALSKATEAAEHALQGRGRVLIRPSGTEPKLRIMVEAQDANEAQQTAQSLAGLLTGLLTA